MTRPLAERTLLTLRTVRHLRPAQVGHRVRLRAQRALVRHVPGGAVTRVGPAGPAPGWPPFVPLDGRLSEAHPSAAANAGGRFRFLGDERHVGADWQQLEAPQLWRFHLHYFDWAWSFASDDDAGWARDAFGGLWSSWTAGTRFGHGDPWSPYVVSLRSWALCGVHSRLVVGTGHERSVVAHQRVAATFLRHNLELDVGGNHLIKNIKALLGLGIFLNDERSVEVATRHLRRQLPIQVLADGGHFERSPSYHCQVLGDLVDIEDLLAAAGRTPLPGLAGAIAAMRSWLGAMLLPDGDVPLFNDCTLVGGPRLALLRPDPPTDRRLVVLQPSGYVVVRTAEGLHLVADVGPPCPPDLPAHAHADCLSFELVVDGRRTIVDTGVSTYAAGPRRDHERSTAAHNTVDVDGADQSEVWGAFRVARRARPFLERAVEHDGFVEVAASHDGYRRLDGSPRHRRTWRASGRRLDITDEVGGRGTHTIRASLHLPGGTAPAPRTGTDRTIDAGPLIITCDGGTDLDGAAGLTTQVRPAQLATGFGACSPGHAVTCSVSGPLPLVIHTRLDLAPAAPTAREAAIPTTDRVRAPAGERPR